MSPKLLGWTPFKHLSVYTWFPSQKKSWLGIHRQNATSKSSASPGKLAFWAVFSCFFVFFGVGDGFRPPLKKKWNRKNKSRPVVERWWGSLILWWLQNEKVEKMRVRGCVVCLGERVGVEKIHANKMNVELSNVRKWLIYFRDMVQWAQKNTLTNPFIVNSRSFLGDVLYRLYPPKIDWNHQANT